MMCLTKSVFTFFSILFCLKNCAAECPLQALVRLPFVLEYAIWRGWHQAVIYATNNKSDCQWAVLHLAKCMAVNGIAVTINAPGYGRVDTRLGIVVLTASLHRNYYSEFKKQIYQLTDQKMNTASYDWLIATRSERDSHVVKATLNTTAIRFDQNIVVAYPSNKQNKNTTSLGLCDYNFLYKTKNIYSHEKSQRKFYDKRNEYNDCLYGYKNGRNCLQNEYEKNYYRTTDRFRNLTKDQSYKSSGIVYELARSGLIFNFTRGFEMVNVSNFSIREQSNMKYKKQNLLGGIHVVQYFKVRENSTLYAYYLGTWSRALSMAKLKSPYPIEARHFMGEEVVVGRCNSTEEGAPTLDDGGPSSPAMLDDVLRYLTVRLNTTTKTKYFTKLGFRTFEGTWTGLLGALIEKQVDVALEPVTEQLPRHQDMDFIFPIADTMCNIYIRQQETSTVRDIFLAPFSAELVGCVVAIVIMASIAVALISRITTVSQNKGRPIGYVEALVWSTGILCQQGATWTPSNPSASVLLIVCLLFAVVTYNAYAAFITSVLSVRVASVDTVAAVLESPHLKIGYIRNGVDQMYLMSTKDVQLNEFYIRGYSDAQNLVSSAEEGLERAAKQDYAFFAGQRAARSSLRSMSQARGRCSVRELPVPSTRAQLAFPLPQRSPYAKPLLISHLMLHSAGALARLESALVPAMPQCEPPPAFASARATDVRSALVLLITGFIAALIIGVGEFGWKKRSTIRKCFTRSWDRLIRLIKSI